MSLFYVRCLVISGIDEKLTLLRKLDIECFSEFKFSSVPCQCNSFIIVETDTELKYYAALGILK